MHLATLDGSAVVLVSASAISLILLAKRYLAKIKLSSQGLIQWLSDIANSVLTAALIVLHRSYVVSATEVDRCSRSKGVVDCSQLQYAIIFVPFVNAFASLVVATAKCFAEVNRVSRLCKLQRKAEARDEEEADIEIIPEVQQPSKCNECFTTGKSCSKSLWSMLAQWLVPAIFSATLSLGEKLDQRRTMTNESLGCTYAMNFPLLESVVCQGVDYLNSEDHLMFVGSNATDTLEVIRKISQILRDVSTNLEANKSHYTSEQMIDIVEEVKEDFRSFRTGRLLRFDALGKINCTEEHRNGTRLTMNEPMMSSDYLKIHLSSFFSIIYLLAIGVSTLLLFLSRKKCQKLDLRVDRVKSEKSKEPQENVCQLMQECENVQAHWRLILINALATIAMWSPFFVQLIAKILFCYKVPDWLSEVAFIATVLFSAFKNIFNAKITRAQNIQEQSTSKSNIVHPNASQSTFVN
uniref:G-protein coupled receptors family 1 profile domain-containing protein n=1 Tax=Trichogramma kaykai TaxID=54128 RepID=A0ABD2WKZ4_9HYME